MTNEPEPNTRAGEALKPFKREERFIVVKRKHLSIDQLDTLLNTLDENCIEPVECVVVESDWPEYETVWQMIEARATGNTRPLPQPSELEAEVKRLTALAGDHFRNARRLSEVVVARDAQIAKLQADGDKLAGAATALRDDMLMRAEMHKHRNNGELVVEAGNGVWRRINEALTEWKDRA